MFNSRSIPEIELTDGKNTVPTFFWWRVSIVMLAILTSAWALYDEERFHPDEAFYMTIARNAAVKGDWLFLNESLDKPPLTFYANALALVLFAVDSDANDVLYVDVHKGEFAGRLPSLFASILLVAVVLRLTASLYPRQHLEQRTTLSPPPTPSPLHREGANTSLPIRSEGRFRGGTYIALAGLLVALFPLRTAFAATAFTDMPMLLLATISLLLASQRQWAWSGLFFVLSLAAKPQSIFYLPLIIVFAWWRGDVFKLWRWLAIVAMGILCLWGWDAVRGHLGADSFYALGQARYTPTMLTSFAAYPARMAILWETLRYTFGRGWVTVIMLILSVVGWLQARQASPLQLLLWGWLVAFISVHVMLTLNTFDRNLIVVLPVAAMVVAWSLGDLATNGRDISRPYDKNQVLRRDSIYAVRVWLTQDVARYTPLVLIVIATIPLNPTIGGDNGDHIGIDSFADYLNSKPIATVIYDRWLDWELDYYMGDWTNKRRVYYHTPDAMVAGALELDEAGVRYFVAPSDENITRWLAAFRAVGFKVMRDYDDEQFVSYALHPPS